MCYLVLQAGGLQQPISTKPYCVAAATGSESTPYHRGEQVTIARTYFPPTADCVWSGGTSDRVIRALLEPQHPSAGAVRS